MRTVVIVGAGPAGTATALALKSRGCEKVVLIDEARFPRNKPCAGGISAAAQAELAKLGIFAAVRAAAHEVTSLRLVGPGGEEFWLGKARSIVLPRERLDQILVEAAVARGVELREGTKALKLARAGERVVGVDTDHGRVKGDWTVIADGGNGSALPPESSPPRHWLAVVRRYEHLDFNPSVMEMIYARELLPGYGWVIPESAQRINLGVCVDAARMGRSPGLHELLRRFEKHHLGSRLNGALPVDRVHGRPIAWRWAVPRLSQPGVLWVGEAAGLTSPITGEGIRHALASGMAAARALDADTDARVESEYQWLLRKRFALHLLLAAGFFRLAGNPVFPPAVSGLSRGILGRLGTMVLERL